MPWWKQHSTRRRIFHQRSGITFTEESSEMLHLEHSFVWCWYLDTSKVDQKHLESFKMWCSKRLEKISWTVRVRNENVLRRVKELKNILHIITRSRSNWIGYILRKNRLIKHIIEGKIEGGIEVTQRQRRKHRQLLHNHKERGWYCNLKEEALHSTLWRTRFGRSYGPVVTIYGMNEWMNEWTNEWIKEYKLHASSRCPASHRSRQISS
jgi:hypothetical protein